jgi:D-arabinose 1-dehydrogenase-like Zn-dependent alcohol dehydrogenase
MFENREQLQEILKKANQHARKQAKESGASIYYIKNNKRVREDAEGKKFEIIFDATGKRQEFEYHE